MGGAAVTEVQALLGHASPATHSHWFKTIDSRAVNRLSALILGSENSGYEVGTAQKHQLVEMAKSA